MMEVLSDNNQLDMMVGQPVDIAPWSYAWRVDRAIQEKPVAYFIPRRLERIDKMHRTVYYEMPDLLKPLPPQFDNFAEAFVNLGY